MKFALLTLLLLSGGAFAEGLRLFRAGDAAGALLSFEQELRTAGERASLELHYDRALAALHAGAWQAVEESEQVLSERGAASWTSRIALLRACLFALRAEEAAALAGAPGAIPADWDLALARGRAGLEAFALALDSSELDLPAARRNAARLMHRLAAWERARAAAFPPKSEATPTPHPQPTRVEELLQRLERMDRPPETRAAPEASGVERDW